ncbi:MAG: radical SAM protein [Planctomycetota bacterium]
MKDLDKHTGRLRSKDIISLLSVRPLWRLAAGIVRAPLDEDFAGSPLAVCWFTNFKCNAKCKFCCKAAQIRAGVDEFPVLPLESVKSLLEKIRGTVDLLYLSGGEPTIHPYIIQILEEAKRLNFRSLGMSSNLIALDRCPEVLDYLNAISISIHAPDVKTHAANLGVPMNVAEKVFKNIDIIKNHSRSKKIKVLVNCVINPANLDAVIDMVEFTRKRGFLLELVPANNNGLTPEDLAGNTAYENLIDHIIELRKSGTAPHIAGSTGYYRRIRDFEPFRCFPMGVPNIMPDGRLCTPCDVSAQYAVNVLDYASLKDAINASKPYYGKYPCKSGRCFKAGIIERSHLFGLLVSGKHEENKQNRD